MAKTTKKLDLNGLKGLIWTNECFAVSKCKIQKEVPSKLSRVHITDKMWSDYVTGSKAPGPNRVKLIDMDLPGTASVWFNGPLGLPLWAALAGDVATCTQLLDKLLIAHLQGHVGMLLSRKVVSTMTLAEKCFSLIEISMPSSYYQKPTNENDWLRQDDVKFNSWVDLKKIINDYRGDFFNLAQIMEITPNIIGQSYSDGKNEIKKAKFGIFKSSAQRKYLVTSPLYILGFFAAKELVLNSEEMTKSRSLKKLPAYFTNGISEALEVFGKDVQKYVAENM